MSVFKNILIIDGDAREASAIEAILKAEKCSQVAIIGDAEKVPEAASAAAQLVLFALEPHQLAAQFAIARNLGRRLQVPVVLVIDEAARIELEKAGERLGSGYVLKPVKARELCLAIEAASRIHELELRMTRMETRLKEVHRLESIGIMAGGVAHEFNNIITAIFGSVSMGQADLPPTSPVWQRLEQIEKAATRAAELCQRLVAPAGTHLKAQAGVSLNQVVEDTLRFVQDELPAAIKIQTGLMEGLPLLRAIEAHIRQVVVNLVTNAVEAIGDKGGVIRVVTFAKRFEQPVPPSAGTKDEIKAGDYVVLEVADTGCGMDAAVQEKIYDPAFSTKNAHRGLGLASVWRIVHKHHGVVSVESSPGNGAFFRIFLPSEPDKHPQAQVRTSETAAFSPVTSPGLVNGTGKTVLVVDDDEAVRELAKWVIQRAGHTVIVARDGDEAVRLVRADATRFSLILLDLTMPRMGGLEAMQKIRALNPSQPIVIVTGHGESMLAGEVPDRSVGFLQKPFNPDRLRNTLGKYFSGNTT